MVWGETKLCNTQMYIPVYLGTEITWKHKWQKIMRTVGLGGAGCAFNPRTPDRGRGILNLRPV